MHKWERHLWLILPPFLPPAHGHGLSPPHFSLFSLPPWAVAIPANAPIIPLLSSWADTAARPNTARPASLLPSITDKRALLNNVIVYLRVNDANTASLALWGA